MYYLPADGEELIVIGTKPFYNIGDTVNVTCKTGPSRPKAILQWLINDKEPPIEYLYSGDDHSATVSSSNQLRNASLSLKFAAETRYFVNGIMTLTCTCLISLQYSLSSEVTLTADSKSTSNFMSVEEGEGTVITGVQSTYNVDDRINLTCSSQKAKPTAPQLIWLINNEEATTDMLRYSPIALTDDGSEKSLLRLEFVFNAAFIDIWSIKKKGKTQITFKCKAKYIKPLIENKKEEIIRRFEPRSTELQISTNEVGAGLFVVLIFILI
ncbi:beat protein-like protein, partial [Leptotrombidium deliense]